MTVTMRPLSDFRATLGHFASGVVVITGAVEGLPRGLACQSFFSLSLDPPLVAVAVARSSSSWPDIARSGAFCANVLASDQLDLCMRFAQSGTDKFAGVEWAPGVTGSPRLQSCLAWIDCTIKDIHDAGDHVLAIGEVRHVEVGAGRPLLFYRGEFGRLHERSKQRRPDWEVIAFDVYPHLA
jgi:3-hydroxy-9,10-secoandrosta-1,3,5(10)-triene-9,17-dione monooxygenase reductase component